MTANPMREVSDALDRLLGVVRCPFERTQNPTDMDTHRCVLDEGHDGPHDLACYACGDGVARFVEAPK